MSNNKKISDLPQTSYISDNALIPLVQDGRNNVVTVKELSDKIGERHDRVIAQLWRELKKVGSEFVPKVKNVLASQQWQINELRKQNAFKDREQDNQLVLLNKILRDTVSKQIQQGNQIALLNTAMKQVNSYIDTMQSDVSYLISKYSYTKQNIDDMNAYMNSAYAYMNSAYAYTRQYLDNTNAYLNSAYAYMNSAYTYLKEYIHFSPSEYWENNTNTVESINKFE